MLRTRRTVASALTALVLLVGLSGCVEEAVQTIDDGKATACAADQKVLEIALETYYANGGAPGTATVQALVSAGLLRAESTTFTIVNGSDVVPIAGGGCDTADAAAATTTPSGGATALGPEQCEADRVALQNAVDTFGAAYNVSPMSEGELVRAGLLVAEVPGYDLQGATVVPAAGSCA